MKQITLRLVVLLLATSILCTRNAAFSQSFDFDHYQRLKCEAPIPEVLTAKTMEKYREKVNAIGKSANKNEQALKEVFLLESSVFLDALLRGGKVLFNDPVSDYLNQIKDYLLRDDEKLREKIQVFTMRSNHVNAFATGDGVVIVTTGLVAKAADEATLAFVIGHEIQHYVLQHGINRHLEVEKFKRKEAKRKSDTKDELELEYCQYTQSQELEADLGGLKFYQNSAYGPALLMNAFDLLAYANEPFDRTTKFDKRFFEYPDLRYPTALLMDSVLPITVDEFKDDALHSHPNVGSRRKKIVELLGEKSKETGPAFIFGEERFNEVRTICRFEHTWNLLASGNYEGALFNAYLLLREYPDSKFLHHVTGSALYQLTAVANENRFFAYHVRYRDESGEFQRMLYWLENVDALGLNLAALKWTHNLSHAYPKDKDLRELYLLVLGELATNHSAAVNTLLKTPAPKDYFYPSMYQDTLAKAAKDSLYGGSPNDLNIHKKDRYKTKGKDMAALLLKSYQHALAPYYAQPQFDSLLQASLKKRPAAAASASEEEEFEQNFVTQPVKELLVLTPNFQFVKSKKGVWNVVTAASIEKKGELKSHLADAAKKLKVKLEILDVEDMKSSDIDKFNDYTALLDYLRYRGMQGTVGIPEMGIEFRDRFVSKYRISNIGMVSQSSYPNDMFKFIIYLLIFASAVSFGAGIPFYLLYLTVIRSRFLETQGLIYNLKTNKVESVQYRVSAGGSSRIRLRAHIYDFLYRISKNK